MTQKNEPEIDALLTSLWKRNLTTLHERLNLLDRAAASAASDQLSKALQSDALDVAHKLAGSLGMFGHHRGTDIAREIEQILGAPAPVTSDRLTPLTLELRQLLFGNERT